MLAALPGLVVVFKGNTTLPWWGYLVALISGTIVAVRMEGQKFSDLLTRYKPFSTVLYGRMGNGIATNQLFKMLPGAIHPGLSFAVKQNERLTVTMIKANRWRTST